MFCDLNSKCRTCLSATSSYKIFELVGENYKILEMLDSLVPQINIKTTLQFTDHLCENCVEKLLNAYKFQQMCIETNNKIQDLLNSASIERKHTLDPLMPETDIVVKLEVEESVIMKCEVSPVEPAAQAFLDEPKHEDEDLKAFQGFQCRWCFKSFEKKKSLNGHYRVHRNKNILKVQSKFIQSEVQDLQENVPASIDKELKAVIVKDSDSNEHCNESDKTNECVICGKVFESTYKLKIHKRIHKRKHKTCLCPYCGKIFGRLSNLNEHMKRHRGLLTIQCPECPKRFNCKSDLAKHATSHSNAKPFACDICGSRFTRNSSMLHHKRVVHTAERTYKCNECSMSFKLLYHFKRHKFTHTGEKPHKCNFCDRAYLSSGDLTKHLRTHVGQNTYMCDQCPKSFKYQAELREHQSQHYKMEKTGQKTSEEMLHENKDETPQEPQI